MAPGEGRGGAGGGGGRRGVRAHPAHPRTYGPGNVVHFVILHSMLYTKEQSTSPIKSSIFFSAVGVLLSACLLEYYELAFLLIRSYIHASDV